MTLITLEELARACCVAIGGGIAGQLVVAMPGSALWLIPAGTAVAGCALTVPEIRSEVAGTLPMLIEAGQRVRNILPGGQRQALPTTEGAAAPTKNAKATEIAAAISVNPPPEDLVATLESTPHRLIIGHTRGGKTTLIHHLATSWAQQDERVLVADPDAAPGLWPGCSVTGHGDDLESITRMLEEVKVEVAARRKARAQGTRQFPPLHLVIDEAQDVLPTIEGGLDLFEDIARRGGKLNIRMTVGVQDKQVKTLGLQGKSEVLRNLQVADVLKNRDGQRVAIVRDAETGQKISLAIPDLPNPERLIKPQTPPHSGTTPAPALVSSAAPDPLLAALLAVPAPTPAAVSTALERDRHGPTVSVSVSEHVDTGHGHGAPVTINVQASATGAPGLGRARPRSRGGLDMRRRRERNMQAAAQATRRELDTAYAEAKAAGMSYRKAYALIGGNSDAARAAWKAAPPPLKAT